MSKLKLFGLALFRAGFLISLAFVAVVAVGIVEYFWGTWVKVAALVALVVVAAGVEYANLLRTQP